MPSKKAPPPEPNLLGDAIRKAIAESGLTAYAVAKGSGVSQPVVHRFVSGDRDLTLATASRLCEYLKLRLAGDGS